MPRPRQARSGAAAETAPPDPARVCAWCHRVRDERGEWREAAELPAQRRRARTGSTHGVCPECYARQKALVPHQPSPFADPDAATTTSAAVDTPDVDDAAKRRG